MKLTNLSYTRDGNALLTIEMDRASAESVMDEFQDTDVDVTIKKRSKKRSLDANSYLWVLIGKLAYKLNIGRTEIYRQYIREIGACDIVCVMEKAEESLRQAWESHGLGWVTESLPSRLEGCVNVALYYGSSTYNQAQMSRLIDMVVSDCQENGIPTETPNQILEMKSRWGDN